ncbi:BlaI/MecI/CopY family transcriptional regulator [Streptomyces lavendulocolor]|uniref:BlaI/MecI/CopY family transcriptional regulator n=1 Tax=Streptomyces lavendulocolor TaxID=67316 RepID=UPI0033CCC800
MRAFGELEAQIMAVVWQSGEPVSVRSLTNALNNERPLAYTTVMTVTERLREKGWLTRTKEGRSYRYSAARSAEDYTAELMQQALDASEDRTTALARFVDGLDADEAAALRDALARSSAIAARPK